MLKLGPRAHKIAGRHTTLALLLIVALAAFSLTRLALWTYSVSEADASALETLRFFGIGFVFDLAFCMYASLPFVIWVAVVPDRLWNSKLHRFAMHALTFATIYVLGFLALAEALFWEEFNVRFNFIAVDYLIYTQEVSRNIYESYPIVLLMSGLGVLAFIGSWALRPRMSRALDCADTGFARAVRVGGCVAIALLAYAGVSQPLRQVSANQFQNELASSGPYQFVAAFRNNELDYSQFYAAAPLSDVDLALRKSVLDPSVEFESGELLNLTRHITNPAQTQPLNLMLIMVESLSAEFMGRYGNQEGLTPRLDELAEQSLVFDNFYATGTRTTRGLEAVTLSLPPTPGRSIVKRIGRESGMSSLGNILRSQGYDTRFIYGGRGYFDNMNAFFEGNGYDVVDQSDIDSKHVAFANAWGVSDEDLFEKASLEADVATAKGQPFFHHVMTTSNHRPYTYPEGRVNISSGTNRQGAVKYTDWAIAEFIEAAKQKPWFENTVFVIVADHCASSAGRVDLPLPRYHIPCLIYSPSHVTPQSVATIASQIDLAPTVLKILGVSYSSTFIGRDILSTSAEDQRALIGNYQHLGLYQSGVLTVLSPRRKVTLRDAVSNDELSSQSTRANSLVGQCISYYEGADYIYRNRLNAWQNSATIN